MRAKTWLAFTALAMVTTACGTGTNASDTTVADTTSTTAVPATTSTTAAATTTTTAAPTTTTSAAATTTTAAAATTTTSGSTGTSLRGEPVDLGPPRGAELGVIGVRYNDVLNLRQRPGADQPIVGRIPATYNGLIAQGETRRLPAFWTKVDYRGTMGWVNMSYLAYIGRTDDVTQQTIDHFGERPEASTMTELGRLVAEAAASDDPPSDIVNVVRESTGDLGEVTFDVVGLGDDAVRGVRLHVFGERVDTSWRLRTVEQTSLCHPTRGMDADGTCA
jgi:hypothetical protein